MKIGNIEVYGVIYKITNKINGKCYIGQTVNGFNSRYLYKGEGIIKVYRHHKGRKEQKSFYNKHLLESIEKYGFDAFEVNEIFDIAFSKEELDIKERVYINQFDCYKNGYNQTLGGEGGCGYKHTDETKKIMSELKMEYYKNNDTYNKGKHLSDEHRKHLSENHWDNSGKNHPMAKKVICLTTKKVFGTIRDASKFYDICETSISNCCKGKRKSAGKLNGTKLVWRYLTIIEL